MKATALTIVLVFLVVGGCPGVADDAASVDSIRVEAVDLHSNQGTVSCALFTAADGFPDDFAKAYRTERVKIEGQKAVCSFLGIAAGDYAVSVFHDENSNGKIDRNFMGIPKEGVGASNDAKGRFGPPKFDDARFTYRGGLNVLTIHVRYLLAPM